MPAVYEKMGIRFLYPDNWTLDESAAVEGERSVAVLSPGSAFWSVGLHEREAEPAELALAALAALESDYQDAESEAVEEQVEGLTMTGFELNFCYLDFTNTAWIRAFRLGEVSCLVLCQAEDRELDAMGPVFRAITASLLARRSSSASETRP